MMNTKTRTEAGHGFEAMTEFTLFANMAELEESYGNLAKKHKVESILRNAERKGILKEIKEMIDDGEDIGMVGKIVWDYRQPSQKQIDLANRILADFGKVAPAPDLSHDMNFFSKLISYGIEMSKNLPPTEKQLETLEGMHYCPDCPSQEGMTFTRGTASEFIGKYNAKYLVWKATRASDETIDQLLKAYKAADKPKTKEFCLQYDESTAQKMITQLAIEAERAKEKSVEQELKEMFRQDFIDADSEKRKQARKNG